MHYAVKTIGLSLFIAVLALSSPTARGAELATPDQLLERLSELQQSIAGLEEAGQINHGRATALSQKLNKVSKALTDLDTAAVNGEVTAQQAGGFLGELQRAINALLDFIGELTELVTDLPSEVVQPIIDAAIQLLQDLLGLLLG